jgi:hypothetical protein
VDVPDAPSSSFSSSSVSSLGVTEYGVENEESKVEKPNGHVNDTLTTIATTMTATESKPKWTSLWDFLAKPSPTINPGATRMKRYGISMDGFMRVQPIEVLGDGIILRLGSDWIELICVCVCVDISYVPSAYITYMHMPILNLFSSPA